MLRIIFYNVCWRISLQNNKYKYKKVMDVWMQGRTCPSTGIEEFVMPMRSTHSAFEIDW